LTAESGFDESDADVALRDDNEEVSKMTQWVLIQLSYHTLQFACYSTPVIVPEIQLQLDSSQEQRELAHSSLNKTLKKHEKKRKW
jgi:hypothetical protein